MGKSGTAVFFRRKTNKNKRKEVCVMKKLLLSAVFALCLCVSFAAEKIPFTGLEEANHIAGPAVTEKLLEGKIVLFDYWGLDCPPCRDSMPKLQALWKKYGPKYLVIIASESWGSNREQIKAYIKRNGITFCIYQGATYNKFVPRGVPHAALFGADGKLVKMDHPGRLYQEVAKLCDALKKAETAEK